MTAAMTSVGTETTDPHVIVGATTPIAEFYEASPNEREKMERCRRYVRESMTMMEADLFAKGESIRWSMERSRRRYLGDHFDTKPKKGRQQFVLNRILANVRTQKAVQNQTPVGVEFTGVESGEPAKYGLLPSAGAKLMARAAAEISELGDEQTGRVGTLLDGLTPAQMAGAETISDEDSSLLTELFRPILDPETGGIIEPPVLNEGDMVRYGDSVKGQVADAMWKRKFIEAGGDLFFMENTLYNAIYGWQVGLIQYDPLDELMEITNPNGFDIFLEPVKTCVSKMHYVVFDQNVRAVDLKRMFPDKANAIDGEIQMGPAVRVATAGNAIEDRVQYQEPMVKVRTMWERGHVYDMEVDEAVARRLVSMDEQGEGRLTQRAEDLLLGVAGTIVRPGDPAWPVTKNGINQFVFVPESNLILQDIRCPYIDIPVALNRNIEIPHTPFGISEPHYQEDLQQIINLLWSMFLNITRYNQSPQGYVTKQMAADMAEAGIPLHAYPDKIITVDQTTFDQVINRGGIYAEQQTVGQPLINLLTLAISHMNDLTSNTESLQGKASFAGISGRTVRALQQTSTNTISDKAKNAEFMMERLAKIGMNAIFRFTDPEGIRQYVSDLPPVFYTLLSEDLKQSKFDVKATVVSGRGISTAQKQEQIIGLNQAGLASRQRALEVLEVPNPDKENRLIQEDLQNAPPPQGQTTNPQDFSSP